jgi:hypothetical protein
MDKSKSPSLINLAITAFFLILVMVYGIIALSTQDPVWFISTFDEYPEAIDLYCYGSLRTLRPEDPEFDPLVAVVNETLSSTKNFDSLTMSDATYEYYRTSPEVVALEIVFTNKVRIHSIYSFFSNLDSIVIPLVGRHSNVNAIFGRSNGFSTGGALHYRAMPDVTAFVQESGLCPGR